MIRKRHLAAALGAVICSSASFGLASTPLAGAAPTIDFADALHYRTGGLGGSGWHETGVTSADFDNDGDIDVAVADYFSSNTFRVMENTGNGTFATPGTTVKVQYLVGTLLADDVTGDGTADIVATNSSAVYILEGNGDLTFDLINTYTVPQGGQEDAVITDVDNDGDLDIAVLTRAGIYGLSNGGSGSFTPAGLSLLPSLGGSGIDDADLDGDGVVDMVVSDGIAQVVYAMSGNGDGTSGLLGIAEAAGVAGTVLAGDLNEDGLDDIVALTEFTGIANGIVIINEGDGTFAPGVRYDAGAGPVSGELADLNDDGHLDVISTDTVTSRQVILAGDGSGALAPAGSFSTSSFPQTPTVADLDGDGWLDIASAGTQGFGTTVLSVLINES